MSKNSQQLVDSIIRGNVKAAKDALKNLVNENVPKAPVTEEK